MCVQKYKLSEQYKSERAHARICVHTHTNIVIKLYAGYQTQFLRIIGRDNKIDKSRRRPSNLYKSGLKKIMVQYSTDI